MVDTANTTFSWQILKLVLSPQLLTILPVDHLFMSDSFLNSHFTTEQNIFSNKMLFLSRTQIKGPPCYLRFHAKRHLSAYLFDSLFTFHLFHVYIISYGIPFSILFCTKRVFLSPPTFSNSTNFESFLTTAVRRDKLPLTISSLLRSSNRSV